MTPGAVALLSAACAAAFLVLAVGTARVLFPRIEGWCARHPNRGIAAFATSEDATLPWAAKRRARALFWSKLDGKQRRAWFLRRRFDVIAASGRRYTISRYRPFNVSAADAVFCLQVSGGVPVYDKLLAQKLLLEADERHFLAHANVRTFSRTWEPLMAGLRARRHSAKPNNRAGLPTRMSARVAASGAQSSSRFSSSPVSRLPSGRVRPVGAPTARDPRASATIARARWATASYPRCFAMRYGPDNLSQARPCCTTSRRRGEIVGCQAILRQHVAHVIDDEVVLERREKRNEVAHHVTRRVELQVPAARTRARGHRANVGLQFVERPRGPREQIEPDRAHAGGVSESGRARCRKRPDRPSRRPRALAPSRSSARGVRGCPCRKNSAGRGRRGRSRGTPPSHDTAAASRPETRSADGERAE